MPPIDGAPEVTNEVTNEQPIATDGGQGAELPQDSAVEGGESTPQPGSTPEPASDQETHREDPLNKRFSEVTRARDEALQRAEELERRLRELEEQQTPEPEEEVDLEPVPPEFEDPEQYQRDMAEYTKDLAAWTIRQERKKEESRRQEVEAARKQKEADEAAQAQMLKMQQSWAERREKAIQELPDYVAVAERPDIQVSQVMAIAIATDEMGPQLAYHLGKNPEVAERIANLLPAQQVMELGLLKAQLLAPPVQISNAPPPITPLNGSGSPQQQSLDEMSMEEYAARRRQSQ